MKICPETLLLSVQLNGRTSLYLYIMIENKLTDWELKNVFGTIFHLCSKAEIISTFQKLYPTKIETLDDILKVSREYRTTYLGYELTIFDILELSPDSIHFAAFFRKENSWKDIFNRTQKRIKLKLEDICYEIFERCYPSSIYNEESSALIISTYKNEKYSFVHVYFNANCFHRKNGKTVKKPDWSEHLPDVKLARKNRSDYLLRDGSDRQTN